MNFNSSIQTQKNGVYSFFSFSLGDTNQFRAELTSGYTIKHAGISNRNLFTSDSNFGSLQFYNNHQQNQILFTNNKQKIPPKKEITEEIGQYITDKNNNKKNKSQPKQKSSQKYNENHKNNSVATPQSAKKIKFDQEFEQKNRYNTSQIIYQDNEQSEAKQQPEDIELQFKQEQKHPKRGLTYISKKLSELLRQKKRIKSSQLFKMPFLDEEEELVNDLKNSRPTYQGDPDENYFFDNEKQMYQLKDTKQRRNVRRRIYDSINVMVALGIIKKEKNEYVYLEEKDDSDDKSSLIQQQQILNKKKDYLKKLQNDCRYKQKCLEYLTQAHSKLRILRRINAQNQEKLNLQNQNTGTNTMSLNAAPQQKLYFPFILFQNGNQKLTVELTNTTPSSQQRTIKKVNDWTDCIQVQNNTKQNDIQLIKISGEHMRVISDVDCINLLRSLQIEQNQQVYNSNQMQILRDYQIITLNKNRKIQDIANKNMNRGLKQ